MDPWLSCQRHVTIPEIPITKFEDNFTLENIRIYEKLPDSDQYIAILGKLFTLKQVWNLKMLFLESKLRKLKNDPNVLAQLAAKREACMQRLLCTTEEFCLEEDLEYEKPVSESQILRTIAPQKQAIKQGEILELVKYDQLQDVENEVNKVPVESIDSTPNK